jgi:hypothetical protein
MTRRPRAGVVARAGSALLLAVLAWWTLRQERRHGEQRADREYPSFGESQWR